MTNLSEFLITLLLAAWFSGGVIAVCQDFWDDPERYHPLVMILTMFLMICGGPLSLYIPKTPKDFRS